MATFGEILSSAVTTGSGSPVLATTPTLVTPVLGVATATSVNGLTISTSTGTLTLANGSSLITSGSNSITLTSSGTTNVTLPTAGTLATLAGSEILSGKTLTAPRFASAGFIADASGNELIIFTTTASAVNEWTLANGSSGVNPKLTASGETNVGLDFQAKGSGTYRLLGTSTQAAELRLYEDTDAGTNFTAFKVGTQAGDITYTLPTDDGDSGEFLRTNGSGVLSWETPSGAGTVTSCFGLPASPVGTAGTSTLSLDTETSMVCGAIFIPFTIVVNSIQINVTAANVAGTLDLTVYSLDGQTRHIAVTTASISGTGVVSTAVAGVTLSPGIYFVCANPNGGTTDIVITSNSLVNIDLIHTPGGGRVQYCGVETIVADTPPATIDPTTFNTTATSFPLFRFQT